MHRVVDCETGCDGAAWAVDVEVYWLLPVVCFEEEELGDYAGGGRFSDFAVEADDAFF